MNKLQKVERMRRELLTYIIAEMEMPAVNVSVEVHLFDPSDKLVAEAKETQEFVKDGAYYECGKHLDGGSVSIYL